ncbi:MAG: hypothetical protein CM1200mP39_14260 [Dehalococcoidia bacterium]|nr:MAG: hypothetical protein CM1200mP39_14260 [Dehalococcoidia bacterium]
MEFNVEQGVGYEPASQDEGLPIGFPFPRTLSLLPFVKLISSVEPTRVGQRSDLERLIVEVWTDRGISHLKTIQRQEIP